jgi:heme A synthase
MTRARFVTYAWFTLAVTFSVILWGAYVRASGSGAGCGAHWPTCDGEILPRPKTMEMLVEYTHRVTSGLSGLLVVVELCWALYAFPRRHPARAGAVASMVFMLNEGAIGAALVLLEHVASDRSLARAAWTSAHLTNTFLLVGALACTATWGSRDAPRVRLAGQGLAGVLVPAGAVALLVVGATGAVTALGDTLFAAPSLPGAPRGFASLSRDIADDFSSTAHFLQQLRVVHPIAAVVVAVFVLYARASIAEGRGADAARASRLLAALVVAQLLLGVVSFLLRAPIAMQILHLLAADLVWVAFVVLGAAALGTARPGERTLASRPVAVGGVAKP